MAEAELFQQKLRKHKKDLDFLYDDKQRRLRERERHAIELCKRRQEELEKQIFEQRQIHLDQLDSLKRTEIEFKKHSCLESDQVKTEKERVKNLEIELNVTTPPRVAILRTRRRARCQLPNGKRIMLDLTAIK